MQKLKDFFLMFCFFVGIESIFADMGILPSGPLLSKYLSPLALGLIFAFLILPGRSKGRLNKANG